MNMRMQSTMLIKFVLVSQLLFLMMINPSTASTTTRRRRVAEDENDIPPCTIETHSTSACPDNPRLIQICHMGRAESDWIELCVSPHSWSSRYRRGDTCGACSSSSSSSMTMQQREELIHPYIGSTVENQEIEVMQRQLRPTTTRLLRGSKEI